MADDPSKTSGDISDQLVVESKEDDDTAAAREELKHTAISEKHPGNEDEMVSLRSGRDYDTSVPYVYKSRKESPKIAQPAPAPSRDRALSPSKKRGRDQVDEVKDVEEQPVDVQAVDAGEGSASGSAKDRAEPQKKRARDETSPPADIHKKPTGDSSTAPLDPKATSALDAQDTATGSKEKEAQPKPASSSAFAASGFAKLASSTASPFASLGANKSVFGGAANSLSPFATLGAKSPQKPAAAPTPSLSFGNGDKTAAASPFATIKGPSTGFGSGSGSGFGGSPFASALGTGKITNFGKPGVVLKNDKPIRPFGAPVSDSEDDDEDDNDDGDDEEGGAETSDKEKDDANKDGAKSPADDGKTAKYKKMVIDSGEDGEVTIYQARARMYYLDKTIDKDGKEELAWKERGAGNLKINVPEKTVIIDPFTNTVDPRSFVADPLHDDHSEAPKVVRLILRQDSTLRVVLNTALLPSLEFTRKEGFKTSSVLFTAIEGEDAKPVQVQMKMNNQNCYDFIEQGRRIQEEILRAERAANYRKAHPNGDSDSED